MARISRTLELSAAAQHVRAVYIQAMRTWLVQHRGQHHDYGAAGLGRWDGGPDPYSGRHVTAIWPRLVTFLDQLEAEPESYITAAFALATAHPPTPLQLMNPVHAQHYGQRHALVVRQLELELLGDLERAQIALRQRQAWRPLAVALAWDKVLQDRSLLITPLTRWVIASLYRLQAVQCMFGEEARLQYAKAPSLYSRAWASIMPEAALPLADGTWTPVEAVPAGV